ncbi:hydroxyacylglutathione hydrolase [Thalassotalea atypica]|uniref:hydroxyacylglutathione hydrolase n=1 Tax=Thalassotalea atypica TaxID=2054316 RepID=UPI002573E121|nr:hydroxyacylglutathione hydrolase [Thalassotalea atypica]
MNVNPMPLNVLPIKAFSDNYIWALQPQGCAEVTLVDPGQAEPCIEYLKQNGLSLNAILITHHHPDHTGGVVALKAYTKACGHDIKVYGPATENIPACDIKLAESDLVSLAFTNTTSNESTEIEFSILDLPGHTSGHIAYVHEQALFCGDTLFSGGCGRLFEGTAEQMHQSLAKLKVLPASTPVYCTHEYTQANLHFAIAVEPNNKALQNYFEQVIALRAKNQITLPSTIQLENAINPFLRCEQQDVIMAANSYSQQTLNNSVEVFAAIRAWKDNF